MSRKSADRLVKLMTDVVAIEKVRHGLILAELANLESAHAAAVNAMSDPLGFYPATLARISCHATEAKMRQLAATCNSIEQKLLEDGRQLKLFEARATAVREREAVEMQRDQQAEIIEHVTSASLR